MKNLKTQLGTTVTANLQEGTWVFELDKDMRVRAGKFAILPLENYLAMMKIIERVQKATFADDAVGEFHELIGETLQKLRNHE